jgi:hypothetical protein
LFIICTTIIIHGSCEIEIADLDQNLTTNVIMQFVPKTIFSHQNIFRLDIAMEEPLLMNIFHSIQNLAEDLKDLNSSLF